ncbi:methylmalonyl-CoA mutase family protein [Phascolarctobacterium faecium]|uniref:methylmalonyl-CoA mutase family protein n=1 Tax=Phascolarctobacterium faecium TaxID=33025 RepID=UPI003AF86003
MEQDKNLTAEIQQEETLVGTIPPVTFDEFTPPSYEEWKQEVVTALKGGSFEKSMFTKTYEGITLNPIYRLEDQERITHNKTYPGMASNLRGANAGGYIHKVWTIAQECDGKTPAEANEMVKYELLKGTTAASVVLDTATRKGYDPDKAEVKDVADIGVSLATVADVEKLLDGVDLEKFEIDIYAGASNIALLAAVITVCEKKGLALEKLHGAITVDPIGELALDGELVRPLDEYYDEMAHSIAWAEKNAPQLKTVVINTDVYHNGGANDIQEVAYAMNAAVTYMRAMERRGIDVNIFCRHLRFHFSIGANFFMEIAKLRSLKMVWAQIVKNCGGDEEAQKINLYVSTSTFCQTKYDPYVNLLRAATQSFSAVVGGMDGMYVKPFDHCIRPSDVFSRRIARNIQIMEQHEFNFIQPIDPSGGSWYIEPLTEEFTEKTWAKFQEIESHGGLLAALESGKVQAAVKAILEERFKNLATRKDRAVGNNMYPNMTEELLEVPEVDFAGILKARKTDLEVNVKVRDNAYVEAVLSDLGKRDASELGSLIADAEKALLAGATMGEISAALTGSANGEKVEAIAPHRWTERYEELRMRTENFVDKTGANVKIFLANMGPIPQHKARADFVTSFMQVAAFEVVTNNGFLTVEEAVKAALESGADAAIVCSTDATYPELAPAVTKGIKAVNPEMKVFLAGAPSAELKEICDAAGMDDYISVKSNCYETLLRMQKERGMF